MEHPVQITFRDVDPSEELKSEIERKAEKLESFYGKIESCRVVVETIKHKPSGDLFRVGVRLRVPGEEIVVSRDPAQPKQMDPKLALNEAFREVTRRLQDYVDARRRT